MDPDTTTTMAGADGTENKWWYEQNGQRKGPVEKGVIRSLIADQTLGGSSLLWREGMAEWARLDRTDFKALLITDNPPPLTGEAVSNTIVWWLAFAPLTGQLLEGFLLELTNPQPDKDSSGEQWISYALSTDFNKFWFATLALNIILCLADEKRLKRAGHDTSKMGSAWLVPVYLYRRAQILGQNNVYFWVWLSLFVLTLL